MSLRVLYVSNLYPSALRPMAGFFHVPLFDRLADRCEFKVIQVFMTSLVTPTATNHVFASPPFDSRVATRVKAYYLPKLGHWNGMLFSLAVAHPVATVVRDWHPDVLFSSWLYPDAFGTLRLAQKWRLPLVCDAVGSDVNILMAHPGRRRQILQLLQQSATVVTRSRALCEKLIGEGVPPHKITVLYNGVDHSRFQVLDRCQCAQRLGLDPNRRRILFAGAFLPVKNLATLIEAFAAVRANGFPHLELVLAGTGPLESRLRRRVTKLRLQDAVRITGRFIAHDEVPYWMGAADLLCLPSLHEGVPNVILEALACGLPIVASRVGGIPEVVPEHAGILIRQPTDADELAQTLCEALQRSWDRAAICSTATRFTWDAAAETLFQVLTHAANTTLR